MSAAIFPMVDLQVNGFQGVDFSSPTLSLREVERAALGLAQQSTAGFLATLITTALPTYQRNLALLAEAMQRPVLRGRLLGVHLEGPFLNPAPGAIGVHPPALVAAASCELLDRLIEFGRGAIRMLTVSADVPHIDIVIRKARSQGIAVSLGHHLASESQIESAVAAGAGATTHLGNGLPELIHRHENPLWPSLADDRLAAMVIADGHHLPRAFLKVVAKAKGAMRWMIVSDAAPSAGLRPGRYRWGGEEVVLEPSGRLWAPCRNCLAGSASTLRDGVGFLSRNGFTEVECMQAAFHAPLRYLGLTPDCLSG